MDTAITPGFNAPVEDAARTFRSLLNAMSRPGTIVAAPALPTPPAPMGPAMASVLLTLCDHDTPIALAAPFNTEAINTFIAFHTGAPSAAPTAAAFIFTAAPDPLHTYALGRDDYPDRSATLVVEVAALGGAEMRLTGPGIDGETLFGASLLTPAFCAEWAENAALFPCGVDLILTCGDRLAALPRTTRIRQE